MDQLTAYWIKAHTGAELPEATVRMPGRTPHPLAISKTVLPGNFLGGEAASLHHQQCGFDEQPMIPPSYFLRVT
jgi:hypothetical protein